LTVNLIQNITIYSVAAWFRVLAFTETEMMSTAISAKIVAHTLLVIAAVSGKVMLHPNPANKRIKLWFLCCIYLSFAALILWQKMQHKNHSLYGR
jgi:hypothetical protein